MHIDSLIHKRILLWRKFVQPLCWDMVMPIFWTRYCIYQQCSTYTSSDGSITETDIRALTAFDEKKMIFKHMKPLQLRALNQTVHSGTEQRVVQKRKQINPSRGHFKNKIYRTTFSRWYCIIKYLLCVPSNLTCKAIFECHWYREAPTLTQNEQNTYVCNLKKRGENVL